MVSGRVRRKGRKWWEHAVCFSGRTNNEADCRVAFWNFPGPKSVAGWMAVGRPRDLSACARVQYGVFTSFLPGDFLPASRAAQEVSTAWHNVLWRARRWRKARRNRPTYPAPYLDSCPATKHRSRPHCLYSHFHRRH